MTFSISARCADTGQLGIAISSSSIAVGARCPWLRPGVGAVSSQNITLPSLGPDTLDQLQQGLAPAAALDNALTRNGWSQYRQITTIDHLGRTAYFSGEQTLGIHNAMSGEQCVAAGNMLASGEVILAMVQAFEEAEGQLAERLLASMRAAIAAGGEAGPVHSAALVVVGELKWPIVNLRVDWSEQDPIGELAKLWQAYQPQLQDYIDRALEPAKAPGYGVPGDDR
ncbi:putative Ntn-hydrolase superfamily protein [Pseudomonas oryzihabitans]